MSANGVTLKKPWSANQDDCKVFPNHIMVSLSNHRQLGQASFDKLRMSSEPAEL